MTTSAEVRYATFSGAGWQTILSVRPLQLSPELMALEPSLDWWTEYQRAVASDQGSESQDQRLSGHHVGLDQHRTELKGAKLTDGAVGSFDALWGVSSEGTPAVVTIGLDDTHTVTALSYALPLDDLRLLAAAIAPASQDEWLAAGGQIVGCAQPELGCQRSPTTTSS